MNWQMPRKPVSMVSWLHVAVSLLLGLAAGGLLLATVAPAAARVDDQSDLLVSKSAHAAVVNHGENITYTIVVERTDNPDADDVVLIDTLPPGLSFVDVTTTIGDVCEHELGVVSCDLGDIEGNDQVIVTLEVKAEGALGTVANVATVSTSSAPDDPANNTVTETTRVIGTADAGISKTNGLAQVVPGTSISYTIDITNAAGSPAILGIGISDTLPAALAILDWSCTSSDAQTCVTVIGGAISQTFDLPSDFWMKIIITGTVDAEAVGWLANTASLILPDGVTLTGADTATDEDPLVPRYDLQLSKTASALAATPGATIMYTIVVTNAGPSLAASAVLTDHFPPELVMVDWVCQPDGGAACEEDDGSGNLSMEVTLPVGSQVMVVATGTITSSAHGAITNTAGITAAGESAPGNNFDSVTTSITSVVGLAISKSNGREAVVPGEQISYTIVVSNTGLSPANGALLTDTFPLDKLVSITWTCSGTAGGQCGQPAGLGDIMMPVSVPVGARVTVIATGTVKSDARGHITNTAGVSISGVLGNAHGFAMDADPLTPQARVSILKTSPLAQTTAGSLVTYTIVVTNHGPSLVDGALISDVVPAAFKQVTWTCSGTAGTQCTGSTASTNQMSDTVRLPVGAAITYQLVGAASPTFAGLVTNTVRIVLPADTALRAQSTVEASHLLAIIGRLFLPAVTNVVCPTVLQEIEPNNSFSQADANGPICLGSRYFGMMEGDGGTVDLFKISLASGTVTVTVRPENAGGVQLVLYYFSGGFPVAFAPLPDNSGTFVIAYNVTVAGPYYLYVYGAPGFANDSPYEMAVHFKAGAMHAAGFGSKRAATWALPPSPRP